MNANKQSFSIRHARLLSILFSILIGMLGALIGYALATLAGILILTRLGGGNNSYEIRFIADLLGDIAFVIASFCCGWPVLLVYGLLVGLPINMLLTHYHWRQSITNFSILLVSAILGAVFWVPWNAFVLFSVIATGGLE